MLLLLLLCSHLAVSLTSASSQGFALPLASISMFSTMVPSSLSAVSTGACSSFFFSSVFHSCIRCPAVAPSTALVCSIRCSRSVPPFPILYVRVTMRVNVIPMCPLCRILLCLAPIPRDLALYDSWLYECVSRPAYDPTSIWVLFTLRWRGVMS